MNTLLCKKKQDVICLLLWATFAVVTQTKEKIMSNLSNITIIGMSKVHVIEAYKGFEINNLVNFQIE